MAGRRKVESARDLLGTLEYAVMEAVWAGSPANVRMVLDQLNALRPPGEALAYTTVMTVLGRLVDKELMARERVGRGYEYAPRFTEAELVAHLGQREIAQVLDRYGSSLVMAQFTAALDDADPALLEELIKLATRHRATPEADR